MVLGEASIEYMTSIVMEDLKKFTEEDKSSVDSDVYSILENWMSFIDYDITQEDSEIIDNQIHELMGYMSIWDYDSEFQQSVINKINLYSMKSLERLNTLFYLQKE